MVKQMSKSQATRRNEAVEAKRQEIIKFFDLIGHKQLSDGREISSLSLNELNELLKYGIKK